MALNTQIYQSIEVRARIQMRSNSPGPACLHGEGSNIFPNSIASVRRELFLASYEKRGL